MPKLTTEIVQEGYQESKGGIQIRIKGKQIATIKGLDSLVQHNITKISTLDLSFNLLRNISPYLDQLTGLVYLDLSTNLLTDIEGIEKLTGLQLLRLSRNRLTKITNLNSNRNLSALDLSMNQISRIENINHLRMMKFLYLYGNKIQVLEGIQNMPMLKELRIQQNQLENINALSVYQSSLTELQAHSNNIHNLDDVLVALSHLPKLKVLSLFKNPVADDPTYRFRVLKYKHIENLDGLLVKDYIRDVLRDLEFDYDLDQIVIKSQNSINLLVEHEREVKDTAVNLMKIQVNQLENDFIDFQRSMELELEQLNQYAAIIRTKELLGEDVARDSLKLQEWRKKVQETIKQREETIRIRKFKLEQERNVYLTDQRANIDMSGKLFNIAQHNPKKWKDIKEETWRRKLELAAQPTYGIAQPAMQREGGLRTIEPDIQVELATKAMGQVVDDLGGQMGTEAAIRIEESENQAAKFLLDKVQEAREQRKQSKACRLF